MIGKWLIPWIPEDKLELALRIPLPDITERAFPVASGVRNDNAAGFFIAMQEFLIDGQDISPEIFIFERAAFISKRLKFISPDAVSLQDICNLSLRDPLSDSHKTILSSGECYELIFNTIILYPENAEV